MNIKCKNEETAGSNSNEDWTGGSMASNVSPYEQSVMSGQALKLRKDHNFTVPDYLAKTMAISKRRKRRVLHKRNSYHFMKKLEERNELVANLEQLWPDPVFDILNLVPNPNLKRPFNETLRYNAQFLPNLLPKIALKSGLLQPPAVWKVIGNITNENSTINAITFITGSSGDRMVGPGASSKHNFR